jgi:predicted PurR-regulated permease PerM
LLPVVNFLERKLHLNRGIATLLSYVWLLLILSGVLSIILPPLLRQLQGLNVNIRSFLDQLESLLGAQYMFAGRTIHLSDLFAQVTNALRGLMEPVFGQTLGFAVEVITSLVWVVFIFVVSFYLIKDNDKLLEWIDNLVPPRYRQDYGTLKSMISPIWAAFFRGQLILALAVASIFTVVGFIIGMPYALAMGVLAGLLEFLPSLGHGIWLTIASLVAFFGGSTWLPVPNWVFALIVIGLQLVYQQFDINYLIPRIIGRRVHLPPLVVILGIVSGAVLAGVLGIFLAAPTISSARVIGRYIYANLFDLEPFTDSPATELPPPNPQWWRDLGVKKGTEEITKF